MTISASPLTPESTTPLHALTPLRFPPNLRLTPEQRRGFAPLCPDLVVELASPSDEARRALTALRSKMAAYRANGGGLARQR